MVMAGDNTDQQALVSLLAWYREMGIDEALSETPINWLERGDRAPGAELNFAQTNAPMTGRTSSQFTPQQTAQSSLPNNHGARHGSFAPPPPPSANPYEQASQPRPPSQSAPAAPDSIIQQAKELAATANDLESLGSVLASFDGCSLKATAKNVCFYRGATRTDLMVIGEAPGRDEDRMGKPFVGRAGQLLDKMLAAIGFDEANVHITNTVYWRPPGNRTPTPQEIEICRPFLERQITLVKPKCLLLLGGAAAKSMFATTQGIMRLRGKWRTIEIADTSLPAIASLHPAYLLRTPAAKRLAWRDLVELNAKLKTL